VYKKPPAKIKRQKIILEITRLYSVDFFMIFLGILHHLASPRCEMIIC
jgi:hypothetical protein